MYGNFVHATNDASHYTKPPTVVLVHIEPIVTILSASAKLTTGKLTLKRLNICPWR